MDELAKTEARNYLSAAGFFLIAAYFVQSVFSNVGSSVFIESNDTIKLILGFGLLVIATLLIVLRKRDMTAILFFMMGFYQLFCGFTSSILWSLILIGFLILVSLVTLTSKENLKWLLFLIPTIWFVGRLLWVCIGYNAPVEFAFNAVLAVLCLYYAFCCACERCFIKRYYIGETAKSSLACGCEKGGLPGTKLLTADETTDFKASGSVLGYMLFALITGGYALHYILGEAMLPMETFVTIELLAGSLMIFVSILLLTAGKMRFTPIMFLLVGLIGILSMYSTGAMFIGLGILMIVVGLFAMLRKESRILPGLMLIIYGCTWFFSAYVAGTSISVPVVSALLNAIPCLIAIYLSFVVYSQRKLPKF